jgi:hypothetical protein
MLKDIFANLKYNAPTPQGPVEYIVVGLGNPGAKYENTRHNAGFVAIDALAAAHDARIDRLRFKAMTGECMISGHRVLLMKPETFETWLNRSKGLYSSDVTPSKTLRNAKDRNFQFTLNDGIGGNMSFKTYITKKMAHYQSCMTNLDQYLDYVHPVQIHYYLRGDFSNWGDNPDYGMTVENGVATITLTFKKYAKFKVYGHLQNQWWGTNDMSPDTTAEYTTTGNHDNIYLKPGTYKITFDPQTQLITITPA